MKKFFAVIMSLIFLFVPLRRLAATEAETLIFSAASGVYAQRGETVTVPVSVTGNTGFAAVGFTVTYDTAVLEIISVDQVSDLRLNPEFLLTAVPGSQTVHFVDDQAGGNWFGSGNIFNIIFRVKPDAPGGESPVGLSFTSSPDGKPVRANGIFVTSLLSDGSVIIPDEATDSPQLKTVYPFPGSAGLPSSGYITFTFGEEMLRRGNVLLDGQPLTGGQWSLGNTRYMVPYSGISNGGHTVTLSDDPEHAFVSAGGAARSKYEWSFVSDSAAASSITETKPKDGEKGVPRRGTIELVFREPITKIGNVYLDGGKLEIGWGDVSEDRRRVVIAYILPSDGVHDILATDFETEAGKSADHIIKFIIGDANDTDSDTDDISSGLIKSVYPPEGSSGNEPDGYILIVFTQGMNQEYGSVAVDGVTLGGGMWSLDRLRYSAPYNGLSPGVHYVTVPGGASLAFRNFSGDILAQEKSWTFDVGQADGGVANVSRTVPANGAKYVFGNTDIEIYFGRRILQTGAVLIDGVPVEINAGMLDSGMMRLRIPNRNLARGWHDVLLDGFINSDGDTFSYAFRFEVGDGGDFIGPPIGSPGSGGNGGGNGPGSGGGSGGNGNGGGNGSGGNGNGGGGSGGNGNGGGGSGGNGGGGGNGSGGNGNGNGSSGGGNILLNSGEPYDAQYYYNLVEQSMNNNGGVPGTGYPDNPGGNPGAGSDNNPGGNPSLSDFFETDISSYPGSVPLPPGQPVTPALAFGNVPQTGVHDIACVAVVMVVSFIVSAGLMLFLLASKYRTRFFLLRASSSRETARPRGRGAK